MKIIHLSSDLIGGAARAAHRLHNALNEDVEFESRMIVRSKINDDWRITSPSGKLAQAMPGIRPLLDSLPSKLQSTTNRIPHSISWLSAITAKSINKSDADLVHIHWACAGFLSIEQMARITKPMVWTLHDMWGFCGAEHLAADTPEARWRLGYKKTNRDPDHGGIDVDRWVWQRKKKAWNHPMHIITPSRWLTECARSSALMHDWNITTIPNILDINIYKPIEKLIARNILRLPLDAKLVLFGAIRGIESPHKGWDLLQPALTKVAKLVPNVQGIIFGQGEPKSPPLLGMPLHWLGHLHDDSTLALLYSAADVMVIPSRQEAFGQTGSEAQACGCPVVAFNATGLTDVVEHGITGYLAEPYSSDDLSRGIEWVIDTNNKSTLLSLKARERAVRLWSHDKILPQYLEYYKNSINIKNE